MPRPNCWVRIVKPPRAFCSLYTPGLFYCACRGVSHEAKRMGKTKPREVVSSRQALLAAQQKEKLIRSGWPAYPTNRPPGWGIG